jgi:non-specific protein-tyrosine kinase
MKSVIEEMKSRYDDRFILLDSPPILGGADTVSLAPLADCIIMVVLAGKTKLRDIEKALELVPKEKVLGFVMNRQQDSKQKGYYY